MSETIPTQIRLACGCDVPYEIGQPIYNYYDRVAGEIIELATRSEPDTYGTDIKGMSFPDGKAWWTRTTAGFVDGSRMCCQASAVSKGWLDAAQQFPTTNNNKESNMNDNNNNNKETEMLDGADYIRELEMKIVKLEGEVASKDIGRTAADEQAARLATQVTQLRQAEEDYRHDVRANIGRIEEVLHSHARDCDDQELIDGLIDQINEATRNGFPELRNCTRTYELTITYVVEVQASSEEDARDNFIDGEYDHLIELSDYYELDVEEGC